MVPQRGWPPGPWHLFRVHGWSLRWSMGIILFIALMITVLIYLTEYLNRRDTNTTRTDHSTDVSLNRSTRQLLNRLRQLVQQHRAEAFNYSSNLWLQHVTYTARSLTTSNCIACSNGRAPMYVWPIPYNSSGCNSSTINKVTHREPFTTCTPQNDKSPLCPFWCLMYWGDSLRAGTAGRCSKISHLPIFRNLTAPLHKSNQTWLRANTSLGTIFPDCFHAVGGSGGPVVGNFTGNCNKIWLINHTTSNQGQLRELANETILTPP